MHPLRYTPLHPQWLAFRWERRRIRDAAGMCRGNVLDIGCGDRGIERQLGEACRYVPLDCPAGGGERYGSRPSVFGDAHRLPFPDASFDTVLLLEVLEHLQWPDQALAEARRVLNPGGALVVSVPFLYPIHDAPYDFRRWTEHGIRQWEGTLSVQLVECISRGSSSETAALTGNLALAAITLSLLRRRNPLALLVLLLALGIPVFNLFGWLLRWIDAEGGFMTSGYLVIFTAASLSSDKSTQPPV